LPKAGEKIEITFLHLTKHKNSYDYGVAMQGAATQASALQKV
jgi:hypothetical protein